MATKVRKIYAGDTGVVIRANIVETTEGITLQRYDILRPDKSEYSVTTTNNEETVTNTKIKASVDFPTSGKYTFTPHVEWGAGSKHGCATFEIIVYDKYK